MPLAARSNTAHPQQISTFTFASAGSVTPTDVDPCTAGAGSSCTGGTLTRIDPLYDLVDAERAGQPGFHEAPIAASLTVAAVIALAAFAAAATLVQRGWRQRP